MPVVHAELERWREKREASRELHLPPGRRIT